MVAIATNADESDPLLSLGLVLHHLHDRHSSERPVHTDMNLHDTVHRRLCAGLIGLAALGRQHPLALMSTT